MQCNHCPSMRAGQGGLRIGGRALPTILPGCPCSALPRFRDGVTTTLPDIPLFTFGWPYFMEYRARWRMCPQHEAMMTPKILDVVLNDGVQSDFDVLAALTARPGIVESCSDDIGTPPLGVTQWENGVVTREDSFFTPVVPGEYLSFFFDITVTNIGVIPPFDLTCNFTYKMDRP